MSYAEDPLPQENQPETRTSVRYLEVAPEDAGQRLDKFVQQHLRDVPRSRVYRVIRKGEVRVNGRRAGPATRLEADDKVRLPPVRLQPLRPPGSPAAGLLARIAAAVIHEDERLLVIDKPAGIAVHGGSGVSNGVIEALRALRPAESLELVHRLDRETSGCLLVARQAATLRSLHALLREGALEKRYLALLKGRWQLGTKRIEAALRT
ncbi:MAG TPA: pseudouridine synthase, partial [Steroidobacteraceae bacterium]